MRAQTATKKQILNQLHELDPTQWREVLDFIGYLKHREALRREQSYRPEMTARDLLQSELVGIWADREDIKDSLAFARQLCRRAERRLFLASSEPWPGYS
jgi:hypothetical protein